MKRNSPLHCFFHFILILVASWSSLHLYPRCTFILVASLSWLHLYPRCILILRTWSFISNTGHYRLSNRWGTATCIDLVQGNCTTFQHFNTFKIVTVFSSPSLLSVLSVGVLWPLLCRLHLSSSVLLLLPSSISFIGPLHLISLQPLLHLVWIQVIRPLHRPRLRSLP